MEINRISSNQFPVGRGSRFKSHTQFWELLKEVQRMKIGEDPIKVSSVGASKTSANSLRASLVTELEGKKIADKYELVCARDEQSVYHLYIRRIR